MKKLFFLIGILFTISSAIAGPKFRAYLEFGHTKPLCIGFGICILKAGFEWDNNENAAKPSQTGFIGLNESGELILSVLWTENNRQDERLMGTVFEMPEAFTVTPRLTIPMGIKGAVIIPPGHYPMVDEGEMISINFGKYQ